MAAHDSRMTGLHRLSLEDRIGILADRGFLRAEDLSLLRRGVPLLPFATADKMVENVIGVFGLPFAVAPNFRVNGKDYVVPMVVEEPSVVAGVSGAAKLIRDGGGFRATSTAPVLIGQVQVIGVDDPDAAVQALFSSRSDIIAIANALLPSLVARGGGVRDIEFFKFRLPRGDWTVVLHLLVDTRDAMGANIVNTMCEGIAPQIEKICGGKVLLRILSNLADKSMVRASCVVPLDALGSELQSAESVRDNIIVANDFANADPYRAATHNKGIMNGIDAVAIATGNDWRAIEAGAHAYAAAAGSYRALTAWSVDETGNLAGLLTMPLKVGIVGGSLLSNPGARIGLAISGVASARELAGLMVATGLAQNFAALRALVTSGIQKGHMRLHARSVAVTAGVPSGIFEQVVAGMIDSGDIRKGKAEALLADWSSDSGDTAVRLRGNAATGSASGKVILLGEHAAVYGRHALALPLLSAITAQIVERDAGISVAAPSWNFRQEWTPGTAVVDGAAGVVELIMQEFGINGRGFDIQIDSRVPVAMGLGSSAAFAVAVIRAFDALLGLGTSDVDIDKLAFRCEGLTHGTPSGIDNNLATFGQPVLYSKGSASRTKPIKLREKPPLVIAASHTRGVTRDIVAGVRRRYEQNRTLYETLFDEIDELSVAGAVALRECEYDQLGSMMNVCHGFLNAIEVSTPELEQMIHIARAAGAIGAKLTGAGGGGSIVALAPGKVDDVAGALRAAGFQIISM